VAQARLTVAVGTHSANEMPLVQGCVGWLVCRLLLSRKTSRQKQKTPRGAGF